MKRLELVREFYVRGIIKFGHYKLKSGATTGVYIDLREVMSYPDLKKFICEKIINLVADGNYSRICGVPYGGIVFAGEVSSRTNIPMIMARKEQKDHGTMKMIEGRFSPGDRVLLIEDVVTTGESALETVHLLENAGLVVQDIIAIVDRCEGGIEKIKNGDYSVHALINMTDIMRVREIADNLIPHFQTRHRFELCTIMNEKSTNICLAADVDTKEELLELADKCGPHICILKTHIDIIDDFDVDLICQLRILAERHHFLIWEDRKFSDIADIACKQINGGTFQISRWADLISIHSLVGAKSVECIVANCRDKDVGVILIAEMSTDGNLMTGEYKQQTLEMAMTHKEVVGVVAQSRLEYCQTAKFLYITPGIKLPDSVIENAAPDQKYSAPNKKDSDIFVIGRGIYQQPDPANSAIEYKTSCWKNKNATF